MGLKHTRLKVPTALDAATAVNYFRTFPWELDKGVARLAKKIEKDTWPENTLNVARLLAMALAYWEDHQ